MDPLSIAASITGILAAAAQVSSLLSGISSAPASVAAVQSELEHIRLVFRALKSFVDHPRTISRYRASLIQIEDFTVILTQTVIVFSELETLIAPLLDSSRRSSIRRRLNWSRQETGVNRLANQLQRHKTSLSLLLQIVQW